MIVHILIAGHALCKPRTDDSTPSAWPENERWVSFTELSDETLLHINCTMCKQRWLALQKMPYWRNRRG